MLALLSLLAAAMACHGTADAPEPPDTPERFEAGLALPVLPADHTANAPYPAVEALPTANANFGRAYREEQAAQQANDAATQREHLLLALAYRHHGLLQLPDELAEHQRYQAHLAALGQQEPSYLVRLLAEYRDLWRSRPDDAQACYLFGRACMLTNQLDAADALFRRGLRAAPSHYWLHIARGGVAWQRENLEGAVAHLEQAVRVGLPNGEVGASRLLGRVFVALGDYETAAEHLLQVVRNAPQVELEDYEVLARCWMRLGLEIEAEQLLLYDIPAHLAASARNRHLRTLGDLYRQQARTAAARWAYELYLELHPQADDREHIEQALLALGATR